MSAPLELRAPAGTALVVATDDGVLDGGGGRALEGRSVDGLAPRRGGGWLAVVDRREVWADDGSGWHRLAAIEGDLEIRSVAQSTEGVVVGTSEARLGMVDGGGGVQLRASFDEAPDRGKWYTPWGGPPDARSIAVAPEGALYVNVHVGGIPRADGPDGPWAPTIDIDADVHQVVVGDDGRLHVACALGYATSDDHGATWTFVTDGLHGSYARALAVAGDRLLLSASTGPSTRQAAVYRRPLDGGGPFERCRAGLPEWFPSNVDTGHLAAAGDHAALATGEGELYVSADAGASWERVASGLPPIRAVALARA